MNEGPEAGAGFIFVLVCCNTRNLLRTAVGSPSAASAEIGLSRDSRVTELGEPPAEHRKCGQRRPYFYVLYTSRFAIYISTAVLIVSTLSYS